MGLRRNWPRLAFQGKLKQNWFNWFTYTTPFSPLILFTSTPQASLISVYRVFEDFVVAAKLSTSTQKDSHELSRKLAGMREDSSDKIALLPGEGGKALQSFPPTPDSLCSQRPPRHVKPQAEIGGHLSHRLLSFPAHVSDIKKPNKTNPHKTLIYM